MSEPSRSRPAHLQLLAVSWNFGWPVAAGVALGPEQCVDPDSRRLRSPSVAFVAATVRRVLEEAGDDAET